MSKRLVYVAVIFSFFALINCTRKAADTVPTIEYALKVNLSTLDPVGAANESTNEVQLNIYEGLFQYHYLKRPIEVEPSLADGMPKVSKDGLVHTFKIKKGVKFHDSPAFPDGKGREMKAQDFVYSWKRLADKKNKGEGFWIFDGKIKGLNEWRDKLEKGEATYDTPVEGLATPDDNTLVITLTKPFYQLHYVLTMSYTTVVPKEAVEKWGDEFMNHPVGTGPFVFESWIRGNKVILNKNPNWHGGTYPTEGEPGDEEKGLLADAGKPLPFVDRLVFHEITEDQPRWLNLMKGHLDFAGIPKDNFDGAVDKDKNLKPELKEKNMRLIIYPWPDIVYYSFNMEDPVLGKSAALRQALCYAYDGETAMEKFYNNRVIKAHSPIAPDMEGYDPNFKLPCKEYNLEKAKELMKKAGYPDGKGLPVFEFSTPASTTSRQFAEYISQQWEKIGVKLNLVSHSWPQFQDRLRQKKSQIWGIAWGADYPDAENMLQLLYGKNVSPGPNNANFKNAEFDRLYEQAAKTPPGPARAKLYQQMRDIFARELPWIPTVHRQGYYIVHEWLSNLKPHEIIDGGYKYMRIDQKKKTEGRAKL